MAHAVIGMMLAQAAPAVDRSAVEVQSIWDFVVKGGVLMIPIGLCSLAALTVIVERALSLRRRRIIPPDLVGRIGAALEREGRGRALEICRQDASPTANIFAAAIRRMDEPLAALERHVEQAGAREIFGMRKHLRVLSVVAAVSPLLGLLGTIFGMIRAFQTVATSAEALGRTELLAQGIYQAMITTAAGLIVAIPALVAYHWISSKIDRLVGEMDLMTVVLVEDHLRGTANGGAAHTAQRDGRAPAGEDAAAAPSLAAG